MRVDNGVPVPCATCEARFQLPLPDGWTFTVIGNYGLGAFVTVHKPGCPNGFKSTAPPDEEPDDE